MANFFENPHQDPTHRSWETQEEIVQRLSKKRETEPKSFTQEDKDRLERAAQRIEEERSSKDTNSEKDSHYPENPGHYL